MYLSLYMDTGIEKRLHLIITFIFAGVKAFYAHFKKKSVASVFLLARMVRYFSFNCFERTSPPPFFSFLKLRKKAAYFSQK